MAGRDGVATGQRILDTACELLADVGPDKFSTREVARRAEVTISTLQHHYPNKTALVDACISTAEQGLLELSEEFRTDYIGTVDVKQAATAAIRVGFAYARARQPFFRLLEASILSGGGLDERRLNEIQKPFLRDVAEWLSAETGIPAMELQLRVMSMIMLVTRYALMSEAAMCQVTETDDPKKALAAIERHLISTGLDLATRSSSWEEPAS